VLTRRLGRSTLEVSALSLGSWRTFERLDRDQGLAVMEAARTAGINFLDDARYNDETKTAPIPSGYSEVVFGELFARSGYERRDVIVANKLWWEFWPAEHAADEVAGSLARMGFDYLDVIYSSTLPDDLPLEVVVGSVAGLLESGQARHWAIVNWPGETLLRAGDLCESAGVPQPCAAQLPYNLLRRDWVEGPEMQRALERTGASVVASAALAGGALTGKYAHGATGRLSDRPDNPVLRAAAGPARELQSLALEWEAAPATLAIAFALSRPTVASVLFGATTPEQVRQNCEAAELVQRLDDEQLARLASIGSQRSDLTG
jgi:aryl-alcohol dehydrogenase-like predicted oxidoreductase